MHSTAPMKDLRGYLTPVEVQKLIDHCTRPRTKMMVQMLWKTGARVSEVLNLTVRDIDWQRSTVTLRTLKRRGHPDRVIPLDQQTMDQLRHYTKRLELYNPRWQGTKRRIRQGELFSISNIRAWQAVREAGKRAGIVEVGRGTLHPHHLRHSHAMHALKRGVNLRVIQKVLGHSSLNTTAGYLQATDDDIRDEYEKVWKE